MVGAGQTIHDGGKRLGVRGLQAGADAADVELPVAGVGGQVGDAGGQEADVELWAGACRVEGGVLGRVFELRVE